MTSIPFAPRNVDNWSGGYYEAAIDLGNVDDTRADARLRIAIEYLWSNTALKVAAIGDLDTWDSTNAPSLNANPLEQLQRIYGTMLHPQLGVLPFTSVVVREEIPGEDWLLACVPLGGIGPAGAYPFGDLAFSRAWREPLEQSLAELVLNICEEVPIKIAAIGFEISDDIGPEGWSVAAEATRRLGYIAPEGGKYRYWPTRVWT